LGRKSRLKKQRQLQAIGDRYEAGHFEPPGDHRRAARLSKLRLLTAWLAVMITVPFVGQPGAQQASSVAVLIGGAAVCFDLLRVRRKGVAVAIAVLSLTWFLVLQLVPPAILGRAFGGP
jgi:hypothetical protein